MVTTFMEQNMAYRAAREDSSSFFVNLLKINKYFDKIFRNVRDDDGF